jgi:hypothetical protein
MSGISAIMIVKIVAIVGRPTRRLIELHADEHFLRTSAPRVFVKVCPWHMPPAEASMVACHSVLVSFHRLRKIGRDYRECKQH